MAKRQGNIQNLLGRMEESEKPISVANAKGFCMILFSVDQGIKTREIVQPNKLHYCLGTNEFIKYIALAISQSEKMKTL